MRDWYELNLFRSGSSWRTDLRQQPVANECADDTYYEIGDESESRTRTICPANQPATRPTNNMTKRLSFDICMAAPSRTSVNSLAQEDKPDR